MALNHDKIAFKLMHGARGDVHLVQIGDTPFQQREYGNLADANNVVLARIHGEGWEITCAGANWFLENLSGGVASPREEAALQRLADPRCMFPNNFRNKSQR
jgi:hypothetical protein